MLRPVRLLAPLDGSDRESLRPPGTFTSRLSTGSVALTVAGYNYNSDWTPLLAGLSPAGMAASLAALVRPCSCPASDKLARGAQTRSTLCQQQQHRMRSP